MSITNLKQHSKRYLTGQPLKIILSCEMGDHTGHDGVAKVTK